MPGKRIAIIGLPNTGKTQIFNNLTGECAIVANYPGTTVEIRRSVIDIKDSAYEIIDTPGLHSLHIHSVEEDAVRQLIFHQAPDIIIQCINTSQHKQSLLLTAELLELGIPVILILNSIDPAACQGFSINVPQLEQLIGVPVLVSSMPNGPGKKEILKAITKARQINSDVKHVLQSEGVANRNRARWVENISASVVTRQDPARCRFSHHLTQASREPVLGIPIFLLLIAIFYLCVVYVSGALDKLINFIAVVPVTGFITQLALPVFWSDLLIGPHGVLTLGLFNAVCTVLPILSVFFFIFGCFEDSGYIANFTILSRRIFAKIGIPGHAITSLVLGFGCKTMATLSTRGLVIYKEKFIAVFLIAFAIPCSAQLGISMAILARVGLSAFLIVLGVLVLCEIGAGIALNLIIRCKEKSSFIQVVPALRFPDLKAVLHKTTRRIIDFLHDAVPIFLLSAIGLFILDKTGALAITKQALRPVVVDWMGLPQDILDVFLLALARREAAAGLILKMVDAGALGYAQSIIAVVVTTISFPCVANVIAIGKEMGWRSALIMTGLIFIVSFGLAGALNGLLIHILHQ